MSESSTDLSLIATPANGVPESYPMMIHMPEKLPELLAALAKAQGAYEAIKKDRKVKMRLKDRDSGVYTGAEIEFLYADLAQIIEKTRPALAANGLSFFQPLHQADAESPIFLATILAHSSGCMLMARIRLASADEIKKLGIQITYLRRYSGAPMLGVSSEDDQEEDGEGSDADGLQFGGETTRPRREPTVRRRTEDKQAPAQTADAKPGQVTAAQLRILDAKIKAAGADIDIAEAQAELGVKAIDQSITEAQYAVLLRKVKTVLGEV